MFRKLAVACLAAMCGAVAGQPALADIVSDAKILVGAKTIRFGAPTAIPSGYYDLCTRKALACRPARGWGMATTNDGAVVLTARLYAEANAVNANVNRTMKPVEDKVAIGVKDRWDIGGKTGDCEDFALTKKHRLIAIGWPSSALLVALVKTSWGAQHAVLVVRTDHGDIVLDNLKKGPRGWHRSLYRWEKIQSPDQPWVWNTVK
jgi:predicted transglutaminase-like cysteine proteinase